MQLLPLGPGDSYDLDIMLFYNYPIATGTMWDQASLIDINAMYTISPPDTCSGSSSCYGAVGGRFPGPFAYKFLGTALDASLVTFEYGIFSSSYNLDTCTATVLFARKHGKHLCHPQTFGVHVCLSAVAHLMFCQSRDIHRHERCTDSPAQLAFVWRWYGSRSCLNHSAYNICPNQPHNPHIGWNYTCRHSRF